MSTSHMPSSNYSSEAASKNNDNNMLQSGSSEKKPVAANLSIGKPSGLTSQLLPSPDSFEQSPSGDSKSPISLDDFRILMGIPLGNDQTKTQTKTSSGSTNAPLPKPSPHTRSTATNVVRLGRSLWLRMNSSDPEATASIYYTILEEESSTWRSFYLYDWLVYSFFIFQLVISAVLVLLGALPQAHRIAISVLAAVSGLITGILSLIRGQGLPNRLLQYADGLRKVREDIEGTERELRTGGMTVTFADVAKLRDAYEICRDDERKNHPDTWTSGLKSSSVRFKKEDENVA